MHSFKNVFIIIFIFFCSTFAKVSAGEQNKIAPIVIDKKIAIISSGLPGVGKSTLLKAVAERIYNTTYLDKDVINIAMLQNEAMLSDYYNKYVKNQSYDVMFALACDNLRLSNHIVILDGFFGDKLKNPNVTQFINSSEFETKVIYFYCSKETNEERLRERKEPRDDEKLKDFNSYHQITTEKLLQQLDGIDHLAINTEDDFEDNLEKILNYLIN